MSTAKNANAALERAATTLEKGYGRASVIDSKDPFDHLAHAVIDGIAGPEPAKTCVARLRKTFVDWNEIRIAGHREIEHCLTEVAREDRPTVVANLKAALTEIYDARCTEDFDFDTPLEDLDHDKALSYLNGVEGLDAGRAALVYAANLELKHSEGSDVAPFPAIGRILSRVGLIKRAPGQSPSREAIEALIPREQRARFAYLLSRHGHEVCGVKSYSCGQCVIVRQCEMGKRRIKAAAPKHKAKKAAKAGAKKAAPKKKAAAPKPAAKRAVTPRAGAKKVTKKPAAKPKKKR